MKFSSTDERTVVAVEKGLGKLTVSVTVVFSYEDGQSLGGATRLVMVVAVVGSCWQAKDEQKIAWLGSFPVAVDIFFWCTDIFVLFAAQIHFANVFVSCFLKFHGYRKLFLCSSL